MAYQDLENEWVPLQDNPDAQGDRAVTNYEGDALVSIHNAGLRKVLVSRGSVNGADVTLDADGNEVFSVPQSGWLYLAPTGNKRILVRSSHDSARIIHGLKSKQSGT